MKNRIVLLGPPASGKGTQAELISERLGIPTVSPGAMLRREKEAGTELGRQADLLTREGKLLPDAVIDDLVGHWLENHGLSFAFDGYPRSLGQAAGLDQRLELRGTTVEIVILLDVAADVIRARVDRRRVCIDCGKNFGVEISDGSQACPKCGGKLVGRADDDPIVLEARLLEYAEKTAPLISFYEERGLLARVDGSHIQEWVFASITQQLRAA